MTVNELQSEISRIYKEPQVSVVDYLNLAKKIPNPAEIPAHFRHLRVAFLAGYTIQGFPEVVRAMGIFHNLWIESYQAPYNQVTQEVLNPESTLYSFNPDMVYLLLDTGNILDQMHLETIITKIIERTRAEVVIFDFPEASGDGRSGELNAHLNVLTDKSKGRLHVFKAGQKPELKPYWNSKYKELGDFRFSPEVFPVLAENILRYAVARAGNPRKCLLLDLDDTLWNGVVGEIGVLEIEPFQDLQGYIASLYEKGIILAIASKNNEEDAMEVFEKRPDMILKKDHFAIWRINWQPKPLNIREIAEELNLGTSSMVFVDNSDFELEAVRRIYPEIAVMTPQKLFDFSGFHVFSLTEEDRSRGKMYTEERKRKELQSSLVSTADFLREIDLEVRIEPALEATIARISQLSQRTNQFNLTTRRYTETDVVNLMAKGWKIWTLAAKDKFGDYGIVGVCMVDPFYEPAEGYAWRIDTLLLSCRILGREVEKAFLGHVLNKARVDGVARVAAEFIPTGKNAPADPFLPNAGFYLEQETEKSKWYSWKFEREFSIPEFIRVLTA